MSSTFIRVAFAISCTVGLTATTLPAAYAESVNCDSEGKDLQKTINNAPLLSTVWIFGACDAGPYFVSKDLKLRGPATISAAPGEFAVFQVIGATVDFRDLTIDATGATFGIAAQGSTIKVNNVDVSNSAGSGIHVGQTSFASINNSDLIDNATGIFVTESSSVGAGGVLIDGSRKHGVLVTAASSALIRDTEIINGDHIGMIVDILSNASLSGSTVEGNAGPGVVASNKYSFLSLSDNVNTIQNNSPDVQCNERGYLQVVAPQTSSSKTSLINPACILELIGGSIFAP